MTTAHSQNPPVSPPPHLPNPSPRLMMGVVQPPETSQRYANEVGEAFRPLVHRLWVRASYGVACLYVAADTADKTKKADAREKAKPKYDRGRVVTTAVDTLVWQGLASVVIPGFTINRLCASTLFSLNKFTKLAPSTKKWTTTAVGLGSIPFIVKPIDTFVDFLLDRLMRPFFGD